MSARLPARLFGAIALACLAASARPSAAAVTLRSADITTENYSYFAGPIFSNPLPVLDNTHTVTGPNPFPNDAKNFAGVTEDGLQVLVNLTGSASYAQGNFVNTGSTLQHFRVVFDLDAPAPFTFRPTSDVFSFGLMPTLQAQGQPPVALGARWDTDTTGTLPAGHYTFAGDIDARNALPPGRFSSVTLNFRDVKLTVAPEPAALPLLGAALLLLRRRPRRGPEPR
jgi:hypothetical protein